MTSLELMADNLCAQILDFQQVIANREEGQRHTDAKETNQQCRLINYMLRLEKLIATEAASAGDDYDDDYLPEKVPAKTRNNDRPKQSHITGDAPPITQAEFEQHKHLLADYQVNKETTLLNGKPVDKRWLEYNLLQYYMYEESRNFVADPAYYHQHMDHEYVKTLIRELFECQQYEQQAA